MIFEQLSLNFLSNYISSTDFDSFKKTFDSISDDGHFDKVIKEKVLAARLFDNTIRDDFFAKKNNLVTFCKALPELTQNRIVLDLKLNLIDDIEWNKISSNYFINTYSLNPKFKFEDKSTYEENSLGIIDFEQPDRIFKNLKEYQFGVFFEVYNYISATPFSRCIIQMPTGSGKTRTAIEIASEIINNTNGSVLWLANTQELCDQAFETFTDIWSFTRRTKCTAINHVVAKTGGEFNKHSFFHVCTLQSINSTDKLDKFLNEKIDLNKLKLIIVDEAHISIAPTYRNSIERLISKGAKLIGLTATPGRQLKTVNDIANKNLSEFYFNKLFNLKTPGENAIDYLRNQGILSNVHFQSIEGSVLNKVLSEKEIKQCRDNNTIPKKIEQLLTNDNRRNAIIFDNLVQLLNQDKKIIFFATSIEHSRLITSLLKLKGFKAEHVDGSTGTYRSKIIKNFKNNEVQILCNYGVLSTGFDDPKIDVVFMARPTNSIVLYSQIIGRGLRGPVIGGTDTCEIYTVFDNILDLPENNNIYTYFDEYFEN